MSETEYYKNLYLQEIKRADYWSTQACLKGGSRFVLGMLTGVVSVICGWVFL